MHYKIEPRDENTCWVSVASMPGVTTARDTFPAPADTLIAKMKELLNDPDMQEITFDNVTISRRRDFLRVEAGGPFILEMRWESVFPLVLTQE